MGLTNYANNGCTGLVKVFKNTKYAQLKINS